MTNKAQTSLVALASRGALAVALVGAASAASAGGLDRAGLNVDVIFKDGNYAEVGTSFVMPDVSGVDNDGDPTGNMAEDYNTISGALRYEINDQLSISAVIDEPFGADVLYGAGSNYAATSANVSSLGIAAIARFELNDSMSVHGGVRYIDVQTEAKLLGPDFTGLGNYTYSGDGSGTVFLIGGAYEIPAIAARIAVTYQTETDIDLDTAETSSTVGSGTSTTSITTPARLLIDFQTGIAEDTLLFGSVEHVAWEGFEVAPEKLGLASRKLVDLADDAITYRIGLGRRMSEELSVAGTITYEAEAGGTVSALAATNGTLQFGLGATYRISDMIEIAGGGAYILPGDADVATGNGATFEDNSAIALGARVGVYF